MYADLRRECAERLVDMDFPGYAIGGLSVGEPRELTREMIEITLPLLPADKPRYVMGVGYPDEIVEYAAHGRGHDGLHACPPAPPGMACCSPPKAGSISRTGAIAEDPEPPDPHCGCMVCGRYSRAYLRHLAMAARNRWPAR